MQRKSTEITAENIEKMALEMAQYVQHQSIQYDVPLHFMEAGKLIEQSPTGAKVEIPVITAHSKSV